MHKKVLSVLLASAVSFTALTADAKGTSGPKLSMKGSIKSFGVGAIQKIRSHKGVHFMSSGTLTFNASAAANNGLSYGGIAVLSFGRERGTKDRIKELYAYASSDSFGSIQFGDTSGVSSLMMYDGTDVMGGLGGFDGELHRTLNMPRGVMAFQNIGFVDDGSNRATKVTWLSPTDKFQVGVSYTPSTAQYGRRFATDALDNKGNAFADAAPYAVNHVEGGLSYTDDIGDYTVGIYLTGALGKAKGPKGTPYQGVDLHPVKAWQFGTLVDYQNWQFGAGYFNRGKSYMRRDTKFTNTHGFNLGVSYGMGPVSFALGYTGTERKVTDGKAKADISSFTVDYSVADGLTLFGEVNYFKFKSPAAHQKATIVPQVDYLDRMPSSNKNNSGTAFVLGTRINF